MRISSFAAILLAGSLLTRPAAAETLQQALASAYQTNPQLTGGRAQLRGLDAGVPLAQSEGRPSVSVNADYRELAINSANAFPTANRQLDANGQLTVPLFAGGRIRNAVNAAETRVTAGQQTLRSVEANVLLDTVTAYLNVVRDLAIVDLNNGLVGVLHTNVDYTNAGFRAGDLTRTDIQQSEARAFQTEAQLESALATLDNSREDYLRVVGHAPQDLAAPPPLPTLPATPEEAVMLAIANNPDLLAARQQARAAGYDVRSARGTLAPSISAFGSASYTDYLNTLGAPATGAFYQHDHQATVGVQLSFPLYQGGGPAARVRQAQSAESVALERITETERNVTATVRASMSRYRTSLRVIVASERSVAAAQQAAEGVRAENKAGTRDVIELLNAEQELLNSQVQLVTARRDAYVAGFTLLVAIGRGEASDLGLDVGALYDPMIHYKKVAHDIIDFHQDPKPEPVATTTSGVPMPSVLDVPPPPGSTGPLLLPSEAQPAQPTTGRPSAATPSVPDDHSRTTPRR